MFVLRYIESIAVCYAKIQQNLEIPYSGNDFHTAENSIQRK